MGFPLLTFMVFLPLVGAGVVVLIPPSRAQLSKSVGLLFAVGEVALAVEMVVEFKTNASFQFVSDHPWIGALGISWHLGVDGISLFLVAMAALLFPIAMAGPRIDHDPRSFMGWMLLLEA